MRWLGLSRSGRMRIDKPGSGRASAPQIAGPPDAPEGRATAPLDELLPRLAGAARELATARYIGHGVPAAANRVAELRNEIGLLINTPGSRTGYAPQPLPKTSARSRDVNMPTGPLLLGVLETALNAEPGLTARELVTRANRELKTGVTRKQVNSLLYHHRERFANDGSAVPRWSLVT